MKAWIGVPAFLAAAAMCAAGFVPDARAQEAVAATIETKKVMGFLEGQYLESFRLKKLGGGGEFVLKNELGKRSLIFVIVSPTCTLCRQEVGEFHGLAEEVAKKADLYVVVESGEAAAKRFGEQVNGKFPMLVDPEFQVMILGNFRVNPATIVLDREGKIVKRLQQYQAGQAEAMVRELP